MAEISKNLIVAIDTSHSRGELCFFKNERVITALSWEKQGSHSEILPKKFIDALKGTQATLQDIQRIFCVNGPGSFTGIRVGVNFSKSLAYALNAPIVAINGLDLLAANCSRMDRPILSCIDAQKNSVFVSLYKYKKGVRETILSNRVMPVNELDKIVDQPINLCGVGLERYFDFIPKSVQNFLQTEEEWKSGSLEKYLFTNAQSIDLNWNSFHPLYLKKSSAEEKQSNQEHDSRS